MSINLYIFLALAVGLVVGFVLSAIYYRGTAGKRLKDAEQKTSRLLQDARREAATIKKEGDLAAKDKIVQAKVEVEKELKEQRSELNRLDKRLRNREEMLDRKLEQFDKKEYSFNRREKEFLNREKKLAEKESNYEKLLKEQKELLERLSGLSSEDAKKQLLLIIEEESKFEAAKVAKRVEDEAVESANRKSKEIISLAIQRYASDYVSEHTISTVSLPSDEMKGRIIGREGRNIRALEAATGIELIIDDTPQTVLLSGFDPVRREIARISLERLIADGRVHPARIEEVVEKVKKEIENTIKEDGDKTVFDLGLHGIHPEIVKLLGRLKYRTSYAQNVLQHSREVGYLAGIMAGELRVDSKLARRAGLLHDIGKAVDHEVEGSHQAIGASLARKYGENAKVVNAIEVHHGEGDPLSVEAALVAAADALSAARPGARKESLERYLKRLEKLEELATSFNGVNKCYAIQAGREVRIIVKPEEVNDDLSAQLSRDLAKKIEEELTYPGQIKVTVIRESRYVKYAR
ncbi:ribonuclease Y [bacterium BMS3Abin10]|nr:ribonuclease Y [bacterium BMS3Abin10]GBE39266.1 ribonuclease Y [bacterium BMS3Bbin08]HDH51558.1 ribonuclease Y [Nitrospirota bacterium]HDK16566.1 ribonuclease Y [Nitrospirota bacterium]